MSDKPSTDTVETDIDAQLREAREAFERCQSASQHNHETALNDVRFARLGEQWPADIKRKREQEKRPCLTINKMPAFIRQVVNDSRQNKPSIKVHPADSGADVETAEVINGLIRNIEYTSNADVAYDTAVECAVSGGFGYFRIGMDYAYDDTFDMDLTLERINNPFAVYGDPNSTAADSSDWDLAFVIDLMPKSIFKAKYKNKKGVNGDPVMVDFSSDAWQGVEDPWMTEETVLIAEYWTRKEVEREIVKLSDGSVYAVEDLAKDEDLVAVNIMIETGQLQIENRRTTKAWKVRQRIMSGVDILEDNEWPGKYIPIVPVYGDEFDIEGKRYFRSLTHNASDAQRMFNYWRTASTELVALAPRVPWIGRRGTFDSDAERWNTANTESHSYLEYDGEMPQRIPLDSGPAAGALQEALSASDDMKAIIGLYDASLGARSNETSGRAIMARQREGDVATFHFIDNLTRAIRHAGRILIDLIPKVYTGERIIRILGEDGSEEAKPINQPYPKRGEDGQPEQDDMGETIMAMHDLTSGKYDLTVTSGPSFTTRREEAATQMTEFIRAFPQAAPVIGDLLAKNLDWPAADEIAKRFEKINPALQKQNIPPEVQQAIQQGQQMIEQLKQENQRLKEAHDIKRQEVGIKEYEAETKRTKVEGELELDSLETGVNVLDKIDPEQPNMYPGAAGQPRTF
jgi:hypothetical protein